VNNNQPRRSSHDGRRGLFGKEYTKSLPFHNQIQNDAV